MARDYKNSGQRKKATKKSAPPKPAVPGWLWLFAGCLLGGFGVFLFNLSQQPKPVNSHPQQVEQQEKPNNKVQQPNKEKVEFTFYDRLKEMEVVIPEEELEHQIKQSDKSLQDPNAPKGSWVLQAGAYRKHADADRQKARIALLGVEANIEAADKQGKSIFRVKIGPSNDLRELNDLRERLLDHDISTFVVRIK